MKSHILRVTIFFGIVIVIIGIFSIILKNYPESLSKPKTDSVHSVQSDKKLSHIGDLAFSYTSGENGYVLIEDYQRWAEHTLTNIALFNAQDYAFFSQPDFIGETSPSLLITVFQNERHLSPLTWARENSLISNIDFEPRSSIEPYPLSNVEGITYSINGLYHTDFFIFSYREEIYLISASYHDVGDPYHTEYHSVIASARFQ